MDDEFVIKKNRNFINTVTIISFTFIYIYIHAHDQLHILQSDICQVKMLHCNYTRKETEATSAVLTLHRI